MDQAYLVEEQELKERLIEEAIRFDKIPNGVNHISLHRTIEDYEIVRNRNNNIRKEEYYNETR